MQAVLTLPPQSFAKKQTGFTLIEIMAVMLIVGLVMSMITVGIGDGNRGREVQSEIRVLYQSMQLALEESVFARKQFGIRFDIDDSEDEDRWMYTFLFYDNEETLLWQPFETDELKQTTLMEGVDLRLTIEGEEVALGEIEKRGRLFQLNEEAREEDRIEPDLYFLSSGETQTFKLEILDKGFGDSVLDVDFDDGDAKPYVLTGNVLGQIKLYLPGDELEDE